MATIPFHELKIGDNLKITYNSIKVFSIVVDISVVDGKTVVVCESKHKLLKSRNTCFLTATSQKENFVKGDTERFYDGKKGRNITLVSALPDNKLHIIQVS